MDPNPDRFESDLLRKRMIHNQVLRIREEDQLIGDRIGERDRIVISAIRAAKEAFLCSRPQSSPLGNKTAISSS